MGYERSSEKFFQRTTLSELVDIYFAHVREGRAYGRDGVNPASLESGIVEICELVSRRMRDGSYDFTQYREKLSLRGSAKLPRVISIPTARDRIALRALANFLSDLFPESRQVLAQRKIAEVQRALEKSDLSSYIRLDVKDFYPSIPHPQLMAALEERVSDSRVLRICNRAVSTPTVADGGRKRPPVQIGVPQGLAVSNLLAELAMQPIDDSIRDERGLSYFRYVDDILILCEPGQEIAIEGKMKGLLAERDLKVNVAKSSNGSVSEGFDFLGYRFGLGLLSVRASNIRRIEDSLARLFTKYKYEKARIGADRALKRCIFFVNLRITGCVKDCIARGWLQYFRQMDDEKLISRLDWIVEKHRKRFGVPPEARMKTFTKAFWSIKHPNSSHAGYVPNFDTYTNTEKRDLLVELDGPVAFSWSDQEVDYKFDRQIRKSVIDLEKDVGSVS